MSIENENSNEGHRSAASGRDGPNLVLIGLGIVTVLFVIFFLQNSEELSVDFLFFEKKTTIRWSLLVAVLLGVAIDRIFSIWWRRRHKKDEN